MSGDADIEPRDEYERGLLRGLISYAWWKDGRMYVGTSGTTLEAAILRALSEHRGEEVLPPTPGQRS